LTMSGKLDMGRIRRRSQKAASGGSRYWRPKSGERAYPRVFPFKHTVTQMDIDLGRYADVRPTPDIGDVRWELELPIAIHFGADGTFPCPKFGRKGKTCEQCDKAYDLLKSKDKGDQREGRDLKATYRYVLVVVDTEEPDRGFQMWECPTNAYAQITAIVQDDEFGEDVLGNEGRDFIVDFDKNKDPALMYQLRLRDANKSDTLSTNEDAAPDPYESAEWIPEDVGRPASTPPRGKKGIPTTTDSEDESEEDGDTLFASGDEVAFTSEEIDYTGVIDVVYEDDDGDEVADIDVEGNIWTVATEDLEAVEYEDEEPETEEEPEEGDEIEVGSRVSASIDGEEYEGEVTGFTDSGSAKVDFDDGEKLVVMVHELTALIDVDDEESDEEPEEEDPTEDEEEDSPSSDGDDDEPEINFAIGDTVDYTDSKGKAKTGEVLSFNDDFSLVKIRNAETGRAQMVTADKVAISDSVPVNDLDVGMTVYVEQDGEEYKGTIEDVNFEDRTADIDFDGDIESWGWDDISRLPAGLTGDEEGDD